MKITNEFTVHTPIDHAWKLLTDLEAIAPCMPGAALTGVEGDTYKGKVKVKVGPVISEFAGTARFIDKSDTDYRASIDAKGRDPRSGGNAAAVVTAVLRPSGDSTTVSVDTDLKITGKLAQFGSGMIKEVSSKLLAQFVANLEAKLAAETAPDAELTPDTDPDPAAAASIPAGAGAGSGSGEAEVPSTAAGETVPETAVSPAPISPAPINGTAPAASVTSRSAAPMSRESSPAPVSRKPSVTTAEPEPLDLMSVAGASIYKRLVPVAVGIVVVGAVVAWLIARR